MIINKEYEELQKWYKIINDKFFEGKLPDVVLTIQTGKGSYGWFWANKWGEGNHEINITADHFNVSPEQMLITLHHEMIHLYAYINGIKETSNRGKYHNKVFRQLCEQFHLYVEMFNDQIGYGTPAGSPTPVWKEWFEGLEFDDSLFQIKRVGKVLTTKEPKEKKPSKWVSYICDETGLEFKALRDTSEVLSPYSENGTATLK